MDNLDLTETRKKVAEIKIAFFDQLSNAMNIPPGVKGYITQEAWMREEHLKAKNKIHKLIAEALGE